MIVGIHTQGDRIVVTDVQESVTFAKYKAADNQLLIFADDVLPRWMTCSVMLDYDTVAGGDKFGNFFVTRLAPETSDEVDDDPALSRVMLERGFLNGAPHKVRSEVEYYVGDTITSVHRAVLVPGGSESVVYTTLMGAIGAFVPFTSKDDVTFMQQLEMHMRAEDPPLLGRDHLSYRSYYAPVKGVVDGVMCEGFTRLSSDRKKAIAAELDRTVPEVLKKIEDMQNKVAF